MLRAEGGEGMSNPYQGLSEYELRHLPGHLVAPALWEHLESLLTDLFFLEAKAAAGMVFGLADDFRAAVASVPRDRPRHRTLGLLEEALRRDLHFIDRHAGPYPQVLFQCLWNSCWWFDCDEASAHYAEPAGGWAQSGLPWQGRPEERLATLMEQWLAAKDRADPGFAWLRSLGPPAVPLGSMQRAVLRGHSGAVRCVALSPDGQWIASGSDNATVRVWEAESLRPLLCLEGHTGRVEGVAFSPDSNRVASGSADGTVRVWDVAGGRQRLCLEGHASQVHSVAFSPDGRYISAASGNTQGVDIPVRGSVRVWNAASGEQVRCLFEEETVVYGLAFSPDGTCIAGALADRTVRLWDARDGKELRRLGDQRASVPCVAYSPDGTRLAIGAWDSTCAARVRDASAGHATRLLKGHSSVVWAVAFSPDSTRVATGSWDKTVRLWDASTGAALLTLEGHSGAVYAVAFNADGTCVLSGSSDGTLRIWDVTAPRNPPRLVGHSGFIHALALAPDGARLASASSDRTARVWDSATGRPLFSLVGHQGEVRCVTFSPDGRVIATGSTDKTVRFWEATTGRPLGSWEGLHGQVNVVKFSPDSAHAAVETTDTGPQGSGACELRVYEPATGRELFRIADLPRGVSFEFNLSFSPDGAFLAAFCLDNTLRVWDASTGKPVQVVDGSADRGAALRARAAWNVVTGGGAGARGKGLQFTGDRLECKVVRPETDEVVAWWPVPSSVNECLRVHPGGRRWFRKIEAEVERIALEGANLVPEVIGACAHQATP
jgi:WD40 repeat protein